MFEYSSEKDNISVFDPFPLVFVISVEGSSFRMQFHYIHPLKEGIVAENLRRNKLTLPYNSVSKYNISQIKGLLLDVARSEWTSASNLPIEDFVSIKDGKSRSINITDVFGRIITDPLERCSVEHSYIKDMEQTMKILKVN